MRIVAISDVPEEWGKIDLPGADLLIIAGDLCEESDASFVEADAWIASISERFERLIYVPGNHDCNILLEPEKYRLLTPHLLAATLVDETAVIDRLRFHAMPWDFGERSDPEARIPVGLDVLVTHEPPFGIRDWSLRSKADHLGNRALYRRTGEVAPRLHIFGHCHMGFGSEVRGATTFVNVAICGHQRDYYKAAHSATLIDIQRHSLRIYQ